MNTGHQRLPVYALLGYKMLLLAREWKQSEIDLVQETAERTWASVQHARSKEALRRSEERYRIALQSAEMAAWDWDIETDTVEWNDQHYYLLGLQPGDVTKSSAFFLKFIHPDDVQYVRGELTQAVEESSLYHAEFRVIRVDGQIRWMNGYGRPVSQSAGKVNRIAGVMFDITERKRINNIFQHLGCQFFAPAMLLIQPQSMFAVPLILSVSAARQVAFLIAALLLRRQLPTLHHPRSRNEKE